MSLTSQVVTEGPRNTPVDPYGFGKSIQYSQTSKHELWGNSYGETQKVLFNKGRYFETSIYNKEVLNEVSKLTDIPVQYNNMIVGSWMKLEDFVIAMNILGIYVKIDIDWI